ncbi:MAG: glycosyltransferase [Bacteroidetes bacterium]|nr:glycosyltransferase [Bacteroidota bacterium]
MLILFYRTWFLKLSPFQITNKYTPSTQFTVIIPARNEADNIQNCLSSVLQQNYPSHLFEVIVVNDHSTDNTASIVASLQMHHSNLHLINLIDHIEPNSLNAYKKKAIEIAVSKSKGNWIVTTDADCLVQNNWLQNFDAYIQTNNVVFVAAPVQFINDGQFISIFQVLDFMSLQGITAAAVSAGKHAMCNGANLAYAKKAFYAVGEFKGIDTIASGDDMLLMQKMNAQYPQQLGFLFSKEAVVSTQPMPNWNRFLNQRIRWASKADQYHDKRIFPILLLVYLVNFFLLAVLVANLFSMGYWKDSLLPVSKFFGQEKTLVWFPISQPFHIVYTVVAGWLGKFGTYQWKGRKVY